MTPLGSMLLAVGLGVVVTLVGNLLLAWRQQAVMNERHKQNQRRLEAIEGTTTRLAAIEVKVDTMWAFQIRRAISEASEKGIATLNSPLQFTAEARERLEPIREALIAFGKTLLGMADVDALLQIEQRFGSELLRYVCVPCGLSHGACLLLAMSVARQSDTLDLQL